MPGSIRGTTTQLLIGAAGGEQTAMANLTAMVYDELRALAAAYLKRERSGHSLEPTALIPRDRRHFFAIAAGTMRRVLVEHARTRNAAKRGGGAQRITLAGIAAPDADAEVVALDEALAKLAGQDERQARIVELRFFGGMNVEEVADLLGVSKRTVEADWTMAKAWLLRELSNAHPGKPDSTSQ